MPTVRLIGPSQRAYAAKLIADAPDDYVMKLAKETRSDRQNTPCTAGLIFCAKPCLTRLGNSPSRIASYG